MSHARLSPSARSRWGACPGSVREEARYPESSSGPAAIDGTHTHTLLETCIKNNLASPKSYIGQTLKDDDGEFVVDADRAGRVDMARFHIAAQIQSAQANGLRYEILSEERVNPEFLLGRSDCHGTVDCQLWIGDVYEIIDYKDGMNPVEAKDNPQLELYAIGVLSRFKLNPLESYPFKTVRLTIIQPKLALKGGKPISSYDYAVSDLLAKIPAMMEQAKATDDPNAPLIPGEKQCRFCAHKGACSALSGQVMREVGLMFQPVTNEAPVALAVLDVAQQSADKDPSTMDNEQLRQLLEAAPLIRQLLEAAEGEALRRFEQGKPVPGFKLVRGRGSRSWALPDDEIAEKLIKAGIPKGAVYKSTLVSPAQAEKLTWTKKVKGEEVTAQLSANQIKMLDEYVSKNAGKLTLAPESDSRPAVLTDASGMFAPVAEPAPNDKPALPAWLS